MDKERLIVYIEKVFDGVPQPKDVTLHVAQAHDDWDYDNNEKHRKKDFVGSWNDVPEKDLADCQSALSFLDAEGLRFYLPAYMVWTLKNFGKTEMGDKVLYVLDNHPKDKELMKYQKCRFSLFSKEQLRACALFIKYCAENDENDEIDPYFAKKKYERYWYKYERI